MMGMINLNPTISWAFPATRSRPLPMVATSPRDNVVSGGGQLGDQDDDGFGGAECHSGWSAGS
jgi:hypothetical protein